MIGVWSQSGPCLTLAGAIAARSVVDAVRDEIVKVKLRRARRSEGLGAKHNSGRTKEVRTAPSRACGEQK